MQQASVNPILKSRKRMEFKRDASRRLNRLPWFTPNSQVHAEKSGSLQRARVVRWGPPSPKIALPKGPGLWYSTCQAVSPRGRFAMLRTALEKPLLTGPSITAGSPSRFVRLTCSGILVISCTIFGFSQCYAQDVAEAARQEQARKTSQQKKTKHVYTDEDLKRAQILTPEDRAQVEARKNQQPLPAEDQSQDSADAQALPPAVSLGEVARRYRRLRESLRLQEAAQFHLPFVDTPVLAIRKPSVALASKPPVLAPRSFPVMPVRPVISIPEPPRVEPFQPPVKRSPFERPRVLISTPSHAVPSHPLANHGAPPQAPAVGTTAARPSPIPASPSQPAAPAPDFSVMPAPSTAVRVVPAQPVAPVVSTTPSEQPTIGLTPSQPTPPAPDLSVMPSPSTAVRVAPAQPVAPVVRTTPSEQPAIGLTHLQPTAPAPDLSVMPARSTAVHLAPAQPVAPARDAVQAIDP